jgi:hypothetical protein
MMLPLNGLEIRADYSVSDIVETLRTYRGRHISDYEQARAAYMEELAKYHKQSLKILKRGSIPTITMESRPPVDVRQEYDKMITVFNRIDTATVTLPLDEANRIFNDDWGWNDAWSWSLTGK